MKNEMNTTEEVSNGFEAMLRQHRRGMALHEASTQLEKAVEAAYDTEAKASVTVTVTLKPQNGDQMVVDVQVSSKLPKEKLPAGIMWVKDGNQLETSDPNQRELPLREVASRDEEINEVAPKSDASEGKKSVG